MQSRKPDVAGPLEPLKSERFACVDKRRLEGGLKARDGVSVLDAHHICHRIPRLDLLHFRRHCICSWFEPVGLEMIVGSCL